MNINRIKDLYWSKGRNVREIATELGVSAWALYDFMNKNNIPRRSYSEANYLVHKDKPQFRIREKLTDSEQKLKIAGIMLYWAEGTLKGSTVDFANSNPEMIKIFLKFLRNVCGVNEGRLRVYIYAYSHSDLERVKTYWRGVTRIPLRQFTKPYIREGNPNLSDRKLPCGTVHIRYNDKRLLGTISSWIKEYIDGYGEVP